MRLRVEVKPDLMCELFELVASRGPKRGYRFESNINLGLSGSWLQFESLGRAVQKHRGTWIPGVKL